MAMSPSRLQCPKCGFDQPAQNAICARCGLVFAKYWKYHPRPGEPPPPPVPPPRSRTLNRGADRSRPRADADDEPNPLVTGLGELLLPTVERADPVALAARALLWLVIAIWGLRLMLMTVESNAAGESFLHLINLPFHEAGHVIFMPFGQFIHSLGGTLGQLLMPLICLLTLLIKTRDPFGASVCLWWFGQNFIDIAPYINDARAGVLPLLGGNTGQNAPYGFHDWEFLLTETGLLRHDQAIAQASHNLGVLIMLLALGWGLALLWRAWQALPPRE